jgi:hypothetical protein
VLAQELLPGRFAAALWHRFDAVSVQDVGDSGAADGVAQIGKRALDLSTRGMAFILAEEMAFSPLA